MNRLYTLYDIIAASTIGSIFTARADGPAIRSFHDALKEPSTGLGAHAADYQLLYVGWMDDKGEIRTDDAPTIIATGFQWQAVQQESAQ